jgi:hypothetical protein
MKRRVIGEGRKKLKEISVSYRVVFWPVSPIKLFKNLSTLALSHCRTWSDVRIRRTVPLAIPGSPKGTAYV